jgi:hypothetical protein
MVLSFPNQVQQCEKQLLPLLYKKQELLKEKSALQMLGETISGDDGTVIHHLAIVIHLFAF